MVGSEDGDSFDCSCVFQNCSINKVLATSQECSLVVIGSGMFYNNPVSYIC